MGMKESKERADTIAQTFAAQSLHSAVQVRGIENSPRLLELKQVAMDAVQSELTASDGLSRWPCASFLDLEQSQQSQQSLESTTVLPHSRYFELAADCSDPFVKCSVLFDKREQLKSA